jgi:hypothetical protein
MRASVFQRSGLYFSTSMPASFMSRMTFLSIFWLPTASNSRCTFTPAFARSMSARVNSSPIAPDHQM